MPRLLLSCCLLMVLVSPTLAQRQFGFDNTKPSGQPYLSPDETVKRMQVADGFEVKLFAGEPDMTNPIAFTVDEKGRVWIVESFEYPKRAPQGKMPRDRIRILEDTTGDGKCDKSTVWAEGKDFPVRFDMASGIELGHGGVFLGAPPYLWFLRDTNGDGKCDSHEILLEGFGSQDTHETLNTFQWGPDGWLYGLHGVFTHSQVSKPNQDGGIKMNAAVWRYHHPSRKFEIFSEGTSNPWGMDWRNTDGEFILCCCVIPHLYHMVPGGVYKRQAGASFNPFSYGFINEICDHTFHRESGWAHAGLISLDTPIMPEEFRNSVIFGSIHGCSIKHNILKKNGSTFTASKGDDFLVSGDKNFRPLNMKWGPNGEIYLSDWHDQNPCHQAKPDAWDYERGRIYRIVRNGTKTKKAEDLGALSPAELVQLLGDQNPYRARTAARLLAHHPDIQNQKARLGSMASYSRLGALGVLHATDQLDDPLVETLLKQFSTGRAREETMRCQIVRYLAQRDQLTDPMWERLLKLAREEKFPQVRRELASLAGHISDRRDTRTLLHTLMNHPDDASDPVIPQMIWLAYEPQLAEHAQEEILWLSSHAGENPLIRQHIVPRAMRRLIATEKAEDVAACIALLERANNREVHKQALRGLTDALQNRQLDPPAGWLKAKAAVLESADDEIRRLVSRLSVNFRDAEAMRSALTTVQNREKPLNDRMGAVGDLALGTPPDALRPLINLATDAQSPIQLRVESVRALAGYDAPEIAPNLTARWNDHPQPLQEEIVRLLTGRKNWAKALLDAIAENRIDRRAVSDNLALRMRAFKDEDIDARLEKHWGRYRETPEELDKLIVKMRRNLYEGGGSSFARGKKVFETHCLKCHQFEGGGFEVGPPLDGAERSIEYLLGNVLDPNRVIGRPYYVQNITLLDGRVEQGLLAEESDTQVILKGEKGVRKVIQKADIDESFAIEKSLMPEGLGYNMTEQDFRDLIRYVMADPFLTNVTASLRSVGSEDKAETIKPTVGPPGRIVLPKRDRPTEASIDVQVTAPRSMEVPLLVAVSEGFEVFINGERITKRPGSSEDRPDQESVTVTLREGVNQVQLRFRYEGDGAIAYARFRDPERELRQADFTE